jgi:hypothetical protein
LRIAGVEVREEQAAEKAREHADRQEEAGLAGDETRAVRGYAAARNDAVDVGMMAPTPTIP